MRKNTHPIPSPFDCLLGVLTFAMLIAATWLIAFIL